MILRSAYVALVLSVVWSGDRSTVPRSSPEIQVGPNVHVSAVDDARSHYEVIAAAHGAVAGRLMICSMVETAPSRYATELYVSHDKGLTWRRALLEDPALNSFDPSCAFGAGDHAWFVSIGFPGEEPRTNTRLFHSSDAGNSWRLTGSILPRSVDRPFLAVDRAGNGDTAVLYLHGKRDRRTLDLDRPWLEHLWIGRSVDGGSTFGALDVPSLALQVDAGHSAITSDGTFITVIGEIGGSDGQSSSIKAVRLSRGAASIAPPVKISDWTLPEVENSTRMIGVAAGPGSNSPLYVVWENGWQSTTHVMFASSEDGGATWSAPRALTMADGSAAGGFNPAIAVNRAGIIGVQWYDRRGHSPAMGWSVRFTASIDGGRTFLPSVRVAERDIVPGKDLATEGRFARNGGDTSGLAVQADDSFRSAWVDNRTAVSQVWTAEMTVRR